MSLARLFLAGALAAPACPGAARAEPAPPVYAIIVENDDFDGPGRRYTSGIKHQWLSAEGKGARLARLFLFADGDDVTRFGAGAGHSIFTPDTLGAAAPLAGERPYAGWLYLEAQSVVTRRSGATDILKVAAGVVGPAALGEEAQRTTHRALNFIDPAGWDTQLRNEPGLLVSLDRVWRIGGPEFDVMPFAGASLGNVLTEARGGAIVRVGSTLDLTGLPARVSPARPSAGAHEREGVAWQVYGGAMGRAVAQNIFLDGNTFRDSLSVDREAFVGEFEAGASLQAGRIALGYAHVWRTREFQTEIGGHAFGAVTLSAAF